MVVRCVKGVSRVCQEGVSSMVCVKDGVKGGVKEVRQRVCQEGVKGVSRVCQGCAKVC